jgi:hypothetical protein
LAAAIMAFRKIKMDVNIMHGSVVSQRSSEKNELVGLEIQV